MLGAVLCVYRMQDGSELDGWSRAVHAVSDSSVDSDGLRERVHFFDRHGRCCWRLYLLPDTDFLAWEQLADQLPRRDAGTSEAGGVAERLWRRVALRLGGQAWRANVLRFHAPPAGPGFSGQSLLAASLPRLSPCGATAARAIVHEEGIDCGALIDTCCCRRISHQAVAADAGRQDDFLPHTGFNTRIHI